MTIDKYMTTALKHGLGAITKRLEAQAGAFLKIMPKVENVDLLSRDERTERMDQILALWDALEDLAGIVLGMKKHHREELARLACPYRPGDVILREKDGMKLVVTSTRYDNTWQWNLTGTRLKKDGTLGVYEMKVRGYDSQNWHATGEQMPVDHDDTEQERNDE